VNPIAHPQTLVSGHLHEMDPLDKGLGAVYEPIACEQASALHWNLLREDVSLPAAVLYEGRLKHNLEWMREFIAAYGLQLAPHGKTTMAPRLFQMQLASGAWGITLATAHQTRAAYAHGVRRVLMANQLVGKRNMAMIAELLRDPGFEFYCLVDSAALVDQLGAFFAAAGLQLRVLIELGVAGGRAGVRNDEQRQSVLGALAHWKSSLALCGIEIYEGVLDNEPAIREFLGHAVKITRMLSAQQAFAQSPVLLTGAGSAWFDVVAEAFSAAEFGADVQLVLRPGCYLTHDVGSYRTAHARMQRSNSIVQRMHRELLPALHIWAYVQSIPEAEKAIVTLGKRDAAFDSGLPTPALHFRPGSAAPVPAPPHWSMTKMMDQHAFLHIGSSDDLRIGDMIGFDISHPCLTFDKWRSLVVVNDSYDVVEVVRTWF
jgi:D-serine dehydratase